MTVFLEVHGTSRPISDDRLKLFTDQFSVEPDLLKKQGMEMVGGFRRTGGRVHQLLHLYRFDSVADWDRVYNERLQSESGFLDRRVEMEKANDIDKVTRWTNLSEMVPPGTNERLDAAIAERPERPRQYVETTVTLAHVGSPALGAFDEAYDLIGQVCEESAARGGFQLVASYKRMFATSDDIVVLGISPELSPPVGYTMASASPKLRDRLQKIVLDESMVLLNPFTYSPLQ